jgi:hypothetical protein
MHKLAKTLTYKQNTNCLFIPYTLAMLYIALIGVYIMSKLFAFVGTTVKAGQAHVRFANDFSRIKALQKDGQNVINFVELPEAMTKEDAVMFIKPMEEFQDDMSVSAIEDFEMAPAARVKAERKPRVAGEEQMFGFVGVACYKGQYKVRWANDARRKLALEKDGQTDVRLVQLEQPMTKYDAVMAIKDMEDFEDLEAQQAFDDFLNTNVKIIKAVKAPVVDEVDEDEELAMLLQMDDAEAFAELDAELNMA